MKFCRFDDERLGLIDGNKVRDVTAALDVLPRCSYPLPQHDIYLTDFDGQSVRIEVVAMPDRERLDEYSPDRPEARIIAEDPTQ